MQAQRAAKAAPTASLDYHWSTGSRRYDFLRLPGYRMKMRRIVYFLAAIVLCVPLRAATVSVGSGSYTDSLPAGLSGPQAAIYVSSNVAAPIPTNDWWTSLLMSTTSYRMFAFPLCFRCDNASNSANPGLLIGYPPTTTSANTMVADTANIQQLLVQGTYNNRISTVTAASVLVDGYSDWTVTPLWKDQADPTKYFKATFGHGLLFTYFEFSTGVSPRISFPWDWAQGSFKLYDENSSELGLSTTLNNDYVTIEFNWTAGSTQKFYYGLFLPTGSNITNSGHIIDITLAPGKTFMSIGLMTGKSDLAAWKNYAYAFVTDTKVAWSVDAAKSSVQTTYTATAQSKQGGQATTMLALLPHQHKNRGGSDYLSTKFATIRGTMTVLAANNFTVTNSFRGILPCLPDRGDYDRAHLKSLLDTDKTKVLAENGTYWHGKELCRLANLIPVANQLGETATRSTLLTRLKNDLTDWYTCTSGESSHFFYYDKKWGSLIGYTPEYGLENFTDQHFHFGYFVYASAMLALYDTSFASDYGGMVELLIRSFAAPSRSDTLFPFLRSFDPYEGHSWADGRALTDSGNNQESSSESMNAWAGIYLWGLATGNATYRDLGIWGYVTEYSAIREYYFDIDKTQYPSGYTHNVVGLLWGGKAEYGTWFGSQPEDIHGIQILPLTASLLYLGYDTTYAKANYDQMVTENGGTENTWQDTFWKFQALYDPSSALAKYSESITFDSANSAAFTCHWLHNLSVIGAVDTSVYADSPAYGVFTKSGTKLYVGFNPSDTKKTVTFYAVSGNSALGSMAIPAHAMASTYDFLSVSLDALIPSSSTVDATTGTTLLYSADTWSVRLDVPPGAFSSATTLTLSSAAVPSAGSSSIHASSMGFQVNSDNGLQPSKDLTITVTYSANDINGLNSARLSVARYEESRQGWVLLDSTVSAGQNKIVAQTGHLSRFAVVEFNASQNLCGVTVYPNPYRPGSGSAYDRSAGVVFANLSAGSKIRIYSMAGELVYEMEETGGTGYCEWRAVNSDGRRVASGVYLYNITNPSGEKKTGKIAVIH